MEKALVRRRDGVNSPTIASLKAALPNVKDIDRSSMNAWEDANFAFAALGPIWGSNFIVAIVEQLNFKSTG